MMNRLFGKSKKSGRTSVAASEQDDILSHAAMNSSASTSFLDNIGAVWAAEDSSERKDRNSSTVFRLKLLVLLLLACVTVAGAAIVYSYVSAQEQDEFEYQHEVASRGVLAAIGASIDNTLGDTDALAFAMASHARLSNSSWPFVTLPGFYLKNKKYTQQSKAVWTTVYHLVSDRERPAWEAYTASHNEWIDQDMVLQEKDPAYTGPIIKEREDFNVIHDWDEYDKETPGVEGTNRTAGYYLPNWQSAPVIPHYPVYNWDLRGLVDTTAIDTTIRGRKAVLTEAYLLPDPNDQDAVDEANITAEWFRDYIEPGENPMEPASDVYYPLYKDMDRYPSMADVDHDREDLVAVVAISLYWRDVLKDAISSGASVDVVFRNECTPTFTYRLDGPEVVYLGRGDRHDERFEALEVASYMKDLHQFFSTKQRQSKAYSGIPLNEDHCPFVVSVYPNEIMEEHYTSANPVIFSVVTAFILAFTAFSFVLYDAKVGNYQRRTNRDLEDANKKLREASALQLRHFAMMSHEIRTPLNGIVGMASLFEEDGDDNLTHQQQEAIRMIISSGELLRTVVNDVLDYSKLSAGHQNIEVDDHTNLQESLSSVIFSIETKAQEKDIKLQTIYDENVPAYIRTDGRRLQQILFNLLSNAVKFSPRGETVVLGVRMVEGNRRSMVMRSSLQVSFRRQKTLRFYVEDHGEGIEKENLSTIFEPFAQATMQTERIYGGTGLGLSITKKLAEALGGTVYVESEFGKYARFFVDFPMDEHPEICGHECSTLSPELTEKTNVYLACTKQSTIEKAGSIFGYFQVPYTVYPSMQEMESKAALTSADQNSVFLIDETLFDDQVSCRLASLSCRPSFLTFGTQNLVNQSQCHFRSLEQIIPSSLMLAIDKAISSPMQGLPSADGSSSDNLTISWRSMNQEKPSKNVKDLRVLVAEDNMINQKVITRMLKRIGVGHVTMVDNGLKAAESEAEEEFDVVLMDMEMPVMNGLESCKEIQKRTNGNHPTAPVVFLTAHVLDDIRDECLDAGAACFLGKPYNLQEVTACLQNIAATPAAA